MKYKNLLRITFLVLFSLPNLLFGQKLSIFPSIGENNSNLKWSIAGNESGTNPEVLSKLIWKNVKTIKYGLGANFQALSFLSFCVKYERKNIVQGHINDIDYDADNSGKIVSNEKFNSNKGNGNNFSSNVAISILKQIGLEAYIGYKSNSSDYSILGYKEFYPDLKSSYGNKWRGGFLGLTAKYELNKLIFQDYLECGLYSYSATGNWNLITEYKHPISFMDTGDKGIGLLNNTTIAYKINDIYEFNFSMEVERFKMKNGFDFLYYSNGDIAKTKLNEVVQNSIGFGLTLKIHIMNYKDKHNSNSTVIDKNSGR